MKTLIRVVMAGAVVLALGFVFWTGISRAQEEKNIVLKIADLLEKGDEAGARKAAADFAKKLDDPHDVMALMRPRKTKGLGVGSEPGKITPDGIEKKLQAIARDGITQGVLDNEAAALKKMSYHMAAIAEISMAMKYPEKNMGRKTQQAFKKMSTEMRAMALELAKAIDSKAPATVKTVASKLNTNCNNCHSDFRN